MQYIITAAVLHQCLYNTSYPAGLPYQPVMCTRPHTSLKLFILYYGVKFIKLQLILP